jgi:hypothetical protein
MLSRVEWIWSTGRSNRTKNSLLRPAMTAFAAGADSIITQTSSAHARIGAPSMAMDDRATIARRRDIMIVRLLRPSQRH